MNDTVVALVPMRAGSERVPGKNWRSFAGKPLYRWIVEALLASPRVHEVVVDTDAAQIHDDAARVFPQVTLLVRPEHLRAGTVAMNDVLLHDVDQVGGELFLQTHSTNPLLRTATITRAIERFLDGRPAHDSLFSVTRMHTRLWDAAGRPMNHDPAVLLRTQDLPPVFEENSCLYLFDRATLVERKNRIGARPQLFEIARREAADIDDETDFELAEIMKNREGS